MKRLQLSIFYLQELKYRLTYTALGTILIFLTAYKYKQSLIFIILPKGLSHFITAGLTEIFLTYVQFCTHLSLFFGLLIAAIQVYLFLRPGLYSYEAKVLLRLLITLIYFYLCLYCFIFPYFITLFWGLFSVYSQNFTPIHLTFEPRLDDYLKTIQQLNNALNIGFFYIISLNILQMYTNKKLWIKYRGVIYILLFFIAALITPPDIASQTIVGFPLIVFYELQIIIWSIYKEYKKKILIRQPIK